MYIVGTNELLSHISFGSAFPNLQEKVENVMGHEQ